MKNQLSGEKRCGKSLDLEKAFGKGIQSAVLLGLQSTGVKDIDVNGVRAIYQEQNAYIQLDAHTQSRYFQILRGVRQGDPLSPALFANTIREAMKPLKEEWERKGYGTIIGSNFLGKNRMTYAMFADDTTIVAKSKRTLGNMLASIRHALAKVGLQMNSGKCSVQCVGKVASPGESIILASDRYPLCGCNEGFKVLGTMITMNGNTNGEFEHRLRAGWAKFSSLSDVLMKRDTSYIKRLRLFQATVSKTVLWCAESWKLTVAQKRRLRSTQRTMLRRMVGPKRGPDEEYVSWIKRATHIAETKAKQANCQCWERSYLRAKWRWAGKVANMSTDRWARRTTEWRDNAWWKEQSRGTITCPTRSRPGRFSRWDDDSVSFAKEMRWESWVTAAQNTKSWAKWEGAYVDFAWRCGVAPFWSTHFQFNSTRLHGMFLSCLPWPSLFLHVH